MGTETHTIYKHTSLDCDKLLNNLYKMFALSENQTNNRITASFDRYRTHV